ncbi:WxL domain-containing protein [Enterococcus faecalis]|uniref:WxL domain-containing protein n=1 Tax=Enterococcus faecalis TaxID=1351 RepID=UPI000DEB3C3A|nr:WxL domain-containing protein [Enterococcus faecalis]EGO8370593.1 WxL domain-containing protein [Enterococcus faecalis]EKG8797749.1 WxL domain-containing protein [Enterococcus faecalis]EKJ3566471.1 WxL domain-containing protein [Enterococcus faecalis]ELS1301749.1 WxL domain-containing protein [Enterococcus faecalis]MCB8502272.1 WxL domain-containing protein [Enterococcus faecalis]
MKKKLLASLLVSSAVVGASLAPLSAQAVTTGNTPVQVELGGGTLPDSNGDPNTVRPDPGATNSDFDLLFIPREFDFGKLSISDDLTQPIPNKEDEGEGLNGHVEAVGVGDLRGTKEGWHLTAQSNGLKLGSESLQGNISTSSIGRYDLKFDETTNSYTNLNVEASNPEVRPDVAIPKGWTLALGGEATLMANAATGKGQGLWKFSMFSSSLNITTPAYNIKAGNYTGTITWNLVAGPSI